MYVVDLVSTSALGHSLNGMADVKSNDQSSFHFITFSRREPRVNTATRRLIHSHAQANYRRRNPQHQRRRMAVEVELDTRRLVGGSHNMMSPATVLDANRSDPFGTFPIVGGRRGHQLWDHGELVVCQVRRDSCEQSTTGPV